MVIDKGLSRSNGGEKNAQREKDCDFNERPCLPINANAFTVIHRKECLVVLVIFGVPS